MFKNKLDAGEKIELRKNIKGFRNTRWEPLIVDGVPHGWGISCTPYTMAIFLLEPGMSLDCRMIGNQIKNSMTFYTFNAGKYQKSERDLGSGALGVAFDMVWDERISPNFSDFCAEE